MIKRNKNEEKVHQMLLDCGVPNEQIEEPDKTQGNNKKNPDFIIKEVNIAIEVKHFEDNELIKKDQAELVKFKNGGSRILDSSC